MVIRTYMVLSQYDIAHNSKQGEFPWIVLVCMDMLFVIWEIPGKTQNCLLLRVVVGAQPHYCTVCKSTPVIQCCLYCNCD